MVRDVLCVTEKPSIARALAAALGGGDVRRHRGGKYISNYEFAFNSSCWGSCAVTVTSATGHITDVSFPPPNNKFNGDGFVLFSAPITCEVMPENKKVASNIENLARKVNTLYIWTDCDREGEHIGGEIDGIAKKVNPSIDTYRANFNNTEQSHMVNSFNNPQRLDFNQIAAVDVRRELDLRSGFSLSRLQTSIFGRNFSKIVGSRAVQYGACQFPTLGFIVERYLRIKNFEPEKFWTIDAFTKVDDKRVQLHWQRGRVFDQLAGLMFYERALEDGSGNFLVTKVETKPVSKYKLLPLTTITLQRKGASVLKMSSKVIMTHAEKLYNEGFISYPRTETDRYDDCIDLQRLVKKHKTSGAPWSEYAVRLATNNFAKFDAPRKGKHDDKAHPPIHPVRGANQRAFGTDNDRWRVYEFICRHFLASCSQDAKGLNTKVEAMYGEECFQVSGDQVLELNFLEVYTYMKWTGTLLPNWAVGTELSCMSMNLREGKTSPPKLLTEPDLVGLMDANGIGTDATMADHITKIQTREYVKKRGLYFEPEPLGVALYEGYEKLNLSFSLTKPNFRRDTEIKVKLIADGQAQVASVLRELIKTYENVYKETKKRQSVLVQEARKYLVAN